MEIDPPLPSDFNPEKVARFRALFFEESAELLQEAELCLQNSEITGDDETVGTLFRSIHSIKSGAAALGMHRVVAYAHVFEATLEELRRGSYALDNLRRHLFLRGYDMMATLLGAESAKQSLPENLEAELTKAFEVLSGAASAVRSDMAQRAPNHMIMPPVQSQTPVIRIEIAKIDRLVNLASELTILEGMLRQRAETVLATVGKVASENNGLLHGLDQLALQLRDLHDAAMGARAQPLDNVFQRLPRLVRELAESLDKRVTLTVSGGEVEVDKTIIEQLMEPLTHILRNAIDHGIETVGLRQNAGKPTAGTINLHARCIDNRLLITIVDDGKGLDMAALRTKAAALEYHAETEAELADLIFRPGLSTADTVSEISGRGVGLDAVRHNLTGLGGSITVSSTVGQGTCFHISLPLTLAVMDGMVISIGGELYVLPLTDVQEALRVSPAALIKRGELPPLLRHHDRYIPLVDASILLDCGKSPPIANDLLIAIIGTGIASAALCIDHIVGQQQIVVRPVTMSDAETRISATILGDGRVALILTVAQVMAALQKPRIAA